MNMQTAIKLDDIRTFLPGIDEAEYNLRAKLRTFRNTAASLIASTESDSARQLAWITSDYATGTIYAGVPTATLESIVKLCHRLMVTALQVEEIDRKGGRA